MPEDAGTDDIAWEDLHPETQRLLSRRQMLGTTGKMAASFAVFGGILTVAGCSTTPTTTTGSPGTTAAGTPSTTAGATTTVPGSTKPYGTTPGTAAADSLYTRLGGNAAITLVVTDFVGNVVADPKINHFFAKVDGARLTKLLIEFVDNATGGPEAYTGRDMAATHKGLNITVADFNALVADLVTSLDKYKVPEKEKTELLNALGPLQPQIVTA